MKLLILTQAVDLDDPVLGFMHRWIAELSQRFETVHVICLKEGRHELPKNVFVHSLGKESGRSRFKYIRNFYRYIWNLRHEYDSVFVHMNEEYVVLGGRLWRWWDKRITLWRNHKMGTRRTRRAARLAHTVLYTSPEAFVAQFKNAVKMPIGIDTEFFSPGSETRKPHSLLFLGRLDPVKRVDLFVNALEQTHQTGLKFTADIVGDPTDLRSKYAHDVRNLAAPLALESIITMRSGVTNEHARDLFRTHEIYVNLTRSGSFDKTIGEAMAAGCVVVASNDVVRGVLPDALLVGEDAPSAALALRTALQLSDHERSAIVERSRAWVEQEHSLRLLMAKLEPVLAGRAA